MFKNLLQKCKVRSPVSNLKQVENKAFSFFLSVPRIGLHFGLRLQPNFSIIYQYENESHLIFQSKWNRR